MTTPILDDALLQEAARRVDPGLEGVCVVGSRTSGSFCRPGCAEGDSRRDPLELHRDPEGARAAGLHPCGRCRPDRALETSRAFLDPLVGFVEPGRSSARLVTRVLPTRLGPMIAAACDEGLAFLEFAFRDRLQAQRARLRRRFRGHFVAGEHPVLEQVERELGEYFDGARRSFDTPLALRGTDFQRAVWTALVELPLGARRSYGDLAEQLGRPRAVRAIGHANGANPLSLLVPCHRLVRSDGSLCAYGGGLWRKKALLDHEARIASQRGAAAGL